MQGYFYEKPSSRLCDDLSMIDQISYLCIHINSMQKLRRYKIKMLRKEESRRRINNY